jgi:hypothetical protein
LLRGLQEAWDSFHFGQERTVLRGGRTPFVPALTTRRMQPVPRSMLFDFRPAISDPSYPTARCKCGCKMVAPLVQSPSSALLCLCARGAEDDRSVARNPQKENPRTGRHRESLEANYPDVQSSRRPLSSSSERDRLALLNLR